MLQLGNYLLTTYTYLQIDQKNNYVFGEIPALLHDFTTWKWRIYNIT